MVLRQFSTPVWGAGTGIALVFFPGITSLILGLGKAEFQAEMIENT